MEPIIETKSLSHKQGSKYLIKDINWIVNKKEHWIVFGTNGCGKTTLLSTVCGYRGHNKGECYLFGEKINKENAEILRRRVGFVSSSYMDRCFQNESGLDIILSAKFGGFGRRYNILDEDISRARNLLKAFGVAEKGDYPFCMLSQGQKQRVLLARALMVPPELLILDEPLNGLDIYARDFFLNTLQEIESKTDATIIYVTHHAEEIVPFFKKGMLLKNGEVFAQGDFNQIFSDANLSSYFGHKTCAKWQGDRFYIGISDEFRMDKSVWQ